MENNQQLKKRNNSVNSFDDDESGEDAQIDQKSLGALEEKKMPEEKVLKDPYEFLSRNKKESPKSKASGYYEPPLTPRNLHKRLSRDFDGSSNTQTRVRVNSSSSRSIEKSDSKTEKQSSTKRARKIEQKTSKDHYCASIGQKIKKSLCPPKTSTSLGDKKAGRTQSKPPPPQRTTPQKGQGRDSPDISEELQDFTRGLNNAQGQELDRNTAPKGQLRQKSQNLSKSLPIKTDSNQGTTNEHQQVRNNRGPEQLAPSSTNRPSLLRQLYTAWISLIQLGIILVEIYIILLSRFYRGRIIRLTTTTIGAILCAVPDSWLWFAFFAGIAYYKFHMKISVVSFITWLIFSRDVSRTNPDTLDMEPIEKLKYHGKEWQILGKDLYKDLKDVRTDDIHRYHCSTESGKRCSQQAMGIINEIVDTTSAIYQTGDPQVGNRIPGLCSTLNNLGERPQSSLCDNFGQNANSGGAGAKQNGNSKDGKDDKTIINSGGAKGNETIDSRGFKDNGTIINSGGAKGNETIDSGGAKGNETIDSGGRVKKNIRIDTATRQVKARDFQLRSNLKKIAVELTDKIRNILKDKPQKKSSLLTVKAAIERRLPKFLYNEIFDDGGEVVDQAFRDLLESGSALDSEEYFELLEIFKSGAEQAKKDIAKILGYYQ